MPVVMDMGFTDSRSFDPGQRDAGEAGQGLHPLGWGELCARLVAAQDLRRAQAEMAPATREAGPGSFHTMAARMLDSLLARAAAQRVGIPLSAGVSAGAEKDEVRVNPMSSSNGKVTQGNTPGSSGAELNPSQAPEPDETRHD